MKEPNMLGNFILCTNMSRKLPKLSLSDPRLKGHRANTLQEYPHMDPHHEKKNKMFDMPHFDLFGSDHLTTTIIKGQKSFKPQESWKRYMKKNQSILHKKG